MTALVAPQHMRALAGANRVRIARAALKDEIKVGETTVAGVLGDVPDYAGSMKVAALLCAQERWGPDRARRLLGDLRISESKQLAGATGLSPQEREAIITRLTQGKARRVTTAPLERSAFVVLSQKGALHLVPEGTLHTACGTETDHMRVVPGTRWVSGRRCGNCERCAGLIVS